MSEFFRELAQIFRGDRRQQWGAIALTLVICLGILLRFVNLDSKIVWIDEIHSFMRVGGYGKTALVEQFEQTIAATETRPGTLMPLEDLLEFQRPPASQNLLTGLGTTIHALATDNPQH
ncbi:MAG: hypothetical protein AAGF75_10930, partial [Cyanobacteria bacterium P01_H01_bin.130]